MSDFELPPQAEPMQHWKFRLDLVLALCALVTTVTTVWLSISQGDDMRRLVQAQSWPYVDSGRSNLRRNPVTNQWENMQILSLENKGVGPARIRSFEIYYKDERVASVPKILEMCCDYKTAEVDERFLGIVTSAAEGQVLRPGEKIDVFQWAKPSEQSGVLQAEALTPEQTKVLDAVWWRFNKERWNLRIEICYCSVFDECWRAAKDPEPVASCPASAPDKT